MPLTALCFVCEPIISEISFYTWPRIITYFPTPQIISRYEIDALGRLGCFSLKYTRCNHIKGLFSPKKIKLHIHLGKLVTCCHSNWTSLRGKGRVPQIHLLRLQIDFLETESCVLIINTELLFSLRKKKSQSQLMYFSFFSGATQ